MGCMSFCHKICSVLVQNFAARLILMASHHHHSTSLLKKLHWLPISECIKYKVACMCFHAVNGSSPTYHSVLLHVYTLSRTLRYSSDSSVLKIQQYKCKTHPHTAPHHHHSTPLLNKLHWLPISECIKYKVACMCFHAQNPTIQMQDS